MKKTFILIIAVVIIIVAIIMSKYYDYKEQKSVLDTFNVKYEQYLDREIYGTDITTIINMAVDDNEKAFVEKDEQGKYIQNDTNSVNIEIKMIDLEEEIIYGMETFYNDGMVTFNSLYNAILFKCTQIDYNSAGQVSYMLFEQIST